MKGNTMKVTIQKLASATGVTTETIRHYRNLGLLHPEARENGYYDYTVDDALTVLLTKELRAYNMNLDFIKDAYTSSGIQEYNAMLIQRSLTLREQYERLRMELLRMEETMIYASCGVRILNDVEEFDGPPTYALPILNKKDGILNPKGIDQWVGHLPFTYVSATIPLESLLTHTGDQVYPVQIGMGSLIGYVESFELPLDGSAYYQPGGHFIRTCITTEDLLALTPDSIRPLIDYAEAKNYVFASCTGGRLLFINRKAEKPLYYLLVWVKVLPKA